MLPISYIIKYLQKQTKMAWFLHRWAKHYQDYFGEKRIVQATALANIPQQAMQLELADPPTEEEVMKCGEVPVFIAGRDADAELLSALFVLCWEKGVILQDLYDAVIVSLCKNKG